MSRVLVRVLVVDDEALARARLIRMLSRVPDVEVVGEASTGDEAVARMRALGPDLLLLDVDMPGMDGFGVAEAEGVPLVVFTTAHAQYAALAFEADAVDYLLKPVVQERLERALEKVRQRISARERRSVPAGEAPGDGDDAYEPARVRVPTGSLPPPEGAARAVTAALLTVHDGGKIRFFDPLRVTRFHAEDKYTSFRLDGEDHLLRESLSALEERLGPFGFVRVHRAELVRVDAVRSLEPEAGGALLRLADAQTVSVSRRFLPALKQALRIR